MGCERAPIDSNMVPQGMSKCVAIFLFAHNTIDMEFECHSDWRHSDAKLRQVTRPIPTVTR